MRKAVARQCERQRKGTPSRSWNGRLISTLSFAAAESAPAEEEGRKKNGVTRRTRKIPSFLAVLPAHPLSLSSPPSRLCPSCALPGNTTSCPLTPSTMITSIKALLQSKERPAFPCGDARSPSKKSSACASSLARNLRRCSMSVRPQTRRNVPL